MSEPDILINTHSLCFHSLQPPTLRGVFYLPVCSLSTDRLNGQAISNSPRASKSITSFIKGWVDQIDENSLEFCPLSTSVPSLLRNLYADQEATVRTRHGTTDWFKIGKGVQQGCILPCLFNLYAEYIIRNAGLDEAQAGIKIAWRNINNLRYADDTILMAESKEELKSFLMKLKEESEKAGLKLNIQKTKIMASSPITS